MMQTASSRSAAPGTIYVVATPIGNLEDITLRALRLLKEADMIACEDTRQTLKLLRHFEIRKRLTSLHEHNEISRSAELIEALEGGASVALVSDAGMPVLSDPGAHLIRSCLARGIPVVPIPGPSALTAALAASGLPAESFLFVGFLPPKQGERRRALETLAAEPHTLVFFEAPHRIAAMLEDALATFGDRPAVLAREMTKLHEEFLRGSLAALAEEGRVRRMRGEITVLIGAPESAQASRALAALTNEDLAARVAQIERENGGDSRAALKQAAREFGITRRDAYQRLLQHRADKPPQK